MNTRKLPGSVLLFLLTLAVVVGCEAKKTAPAQVSGKVSIGGTPVTGGTLSFYTDKGVYPVGITPDGTYTAIDLPEGEAVVTIDTEALNPNRHTQEYNATTAAAGGADMASKYGKGATKTPAPKGAGKLDKSPAGENSPQGAAGSYVKIPKEYTDKAKSPLRVTLRAGSQSHDFELNQ
jgi:hypothetical protein